MALSERKNLILIVGPTAVGKTHVAIRIAAAYNTEIISADSRQCYHELNIGVARPSAYELTQVHHHFIASHTIQEELSAASFEKYALEKAAELFKAHDQLVMTGGTGLYIKAFCEGLDPIPTIEDSIHARIITEYESNGLEWLQKKITEKDPQFANRGEMKNPNRIMRALEVIEATGKSVLDFQKGNKATRDFNLIRIGLELPREELYDRINQRVDKMMEDGLEAEARKLEQYQHLNALQTVGYSELFEYCKGNSSRDKAIELIKQHSRNYAKRQLTWFKRDKEIEWFSPGNVAGIEEFIWKKLKVKT